MPILAQQLRAMLLSLLKILILKITRSQEFMKKQILLWGILVIIVLGCSGKKVDYLGRKNGKLTPCPDSPNCVSSEISEKDNYVEPLNYNFSKDEAYSKLIKVIKNIKGTKIIEQNKKYLYVEFRSAFFRFVDDVEFFFDDNNKIIHLRSASRMGYFDFGANRKRIELIRRMFEIEKKI